MGMLARGLAVLSLTVLAAVASSVGPAAADDVIVQSAGPVQLPAGASADARFLLPAARRAQFRVAFLGGDGQVLVQVDVEPPTSGVGAQFSLNFHVSFSGGPGSPVLEITDGAGHTIHSGPSNGIIAVLIGLKLPGGQQGPSPFPGAYALSFQVVDPAGKSVILPWIAQTRGAL